MAEYYLAYGSNLNLYQMNMRCPSYKIIDRVVIPNVRLSFKGTKNGKAFLTVEKCEGSMVPMGLFLLQDRDIISLDQYEGYPIMYKKEYINMLIKEKEEQVLIYIMNEQYDYYKPSNTYYRICNQGYKFFDFDVLTLEDALKYTKNKQKTLRK